MPEVAAKNSKMEYADHPGRRQYSATGTGMGPGIIDTLPANIFFAVLAIAAFAALLLLYKLYPGHVPNAQYIISDTAHAECIRNNPARSIIDCQNYGFPGGAVKSFGLPISMAGSLLGGPIAKDAHVSVSSIVFVYAAILLVAFAGCFALFHAITKNRLLALLGSVLYLGSPIVYRFVEYGGLGLGISLIPAYLVIDVFLINHARKTRSIPVVAAVLLLLAACRIWAIFLDGYSFLFSSLLSLACIAIPLLLQRKFIATILCVTIYAAACAAAVVVYKTYMSDDALSSVPLSYFRGAGVDTYALLLPGEDSIYHRLLGIGIRIDPLATYSDGSSLGGVFVGYAWIPALLLGGFVLHALRSRPRNAAFVISIILVGLVSLLLSLGPSLKFKSFRETPSPVITGAHYSMPESAAVMNLPTRYVYRNVPGIKNARALVRWLVLFRLSIVVIMVVAISTLLTAERRKTAIALAALCLLELVPKAPSLLQAGARSYARAYTLYHTYPDDLASKLLAGERVMFAQLHDNAGGNQYVTNTLCAVADVRCYNAGGDKTGVMVEAAWPRQVFDIKNNRAIGPNILSAFRNDLVDVVVIPFFDLRNSVYSESQGAVPVDTVLNRAKALADSIGARLEIGGRFAYLRMDQDRNRLPCDLDCWQTWPSTDFQPVKWGPRSIVHGLKFNQQQNGRSSMWFGLPDRSGRYSIALGQTLLPTKANQSMIVAYIPDDVERALQVSSEIPITLVDVQGKVTHPIGTLKVSEPVP